MMITLNDHTTQLILAAVGGAVVSGTVVGIIARWAANRRIRKLHRALSGAPQRTRKEQPKNAAPAPADAPAAPPPVRGPTDFGEHQETWDRLCDLRLAMDRLWGRPTQRNVDEFSRHLEAVRAWAYERETGLEESRVSALRKQVDQLEAFRDNKHGLHDLMRQRPVDEAAVAALQDRYAEVRKQFIEEVESLPAVFKRKKIA
jgi:hypothetical protein